MTAKRTIAEALVRGVAAFALSLSSAAPVASDPSAAGPLSDPAALTLTSPTPPVTVLDGPTGRR